MVVLTRTFHPGRFKHQEGYEQCENKVPHNASLLNPLMTKAWLTGSALATHPTYSELISRLWLSKEPKPSWRAGALRCSFAKFDFLAGPSPIGLFNFVFDRGCFHLFDDSGERQPFAARVAAAMAPGGLWLSLIGSTEGPPREVGPPRRPHTWGAEGVPGSHEQSQGPGVSSSSVVQPSI
jgi:hypothetical protein